MLRLSLSRSFVLSIAACVIVTTIFAAATALAQVQTQPLGATAEVRDAAGRILANAEFREGRGEVVITMIFPSPAVMTGTHGLRITSIGRCDPPDFTTAGGGFNPLNRKHGRQNPDGPQVGDLPNVNFTNGLTSYNTSALGATLGAGQNSLLGPSRTALVIYAGEDDQITDPDGKAGARIGCGVITAAAGAAAVPPAQPAVTKPSPVVAQPAQPAPAQPAPAQPAPAQPAPAKPASSPVVVPPPVVVNPAVPKPGTSPVAAAAAATPTTFVPVIVVPTAVALTAAPVNQSGGGGISSGVAFLIAIVGVGLLGAGYLLRRRSQLSR